MRALELLLDTLAKDPNGAIACAIEYEGDVRRQHNEELYLEENKNYGSQPAFTFASHQVLHSIVDFLATYLRHEKAPGLRFGFYTTLSTGIERNQGRARKLGITLPKTGLLRSLTSTTPAWDEIITPTRELIIDLLHEERCSIKRCCNEHRAVKRWGTAEWRRFLERVDWKFGEEDDIKLQLELVKKLRTSSMFDTTHSGKEEIIIRSALDIFDEKQRAPHQHLRLVSSVELENVFLKAASGRIRLEDPTWQMWKTIEAPEDQRNVTEKITSACPDVSHSYLKRIRRQASASMIEQNNDQGRQDFLAVRFHVFNSASEALELLRATLPWSEADLRTAITAASTAAIHCIQQREQDYTYTLRNHSSIENMVLELFDSCFLSFDE